MKSITDTYTLNNKITIPCLGFGTWQTPDDAIGYNAVKVALEAGYRHIDTAAGYGNESIVGRAIKDSKIPREEIFVTTKLNNPDHGYEETLAAFDKSLKQLDLDYIDLYLIHWPNPAPYRAHWKETLQETWRAFEKLYADGRVRAIGVSNCDIHHLEVIAETSHVVPAVNQIKLCPGVVPEDLVAYCIKKNILLQAYSPLGTGSVLNMPIMKTIAAAHDTSVAAISLRWSIERGFNPLSKSVTPERIRENTKFIDLRLSEDEVKTINTIRTPENDPDDPDTVPW